MTKPLRAKNWDELVHIEGIADWQKDAAKWLRELAEIEREEGKQDRPDSLEVSILELLCSQLRLQHADLEQANTSLRRKNQNLANEVVALHARLRAYEDVAGVTTRLRNALEDAADTLQWLAAGQEIVYAHDVDVVARGMRDALRELGDASP